jgi:hypothetical protein
MKSLMDVERKRERMGIWLKCGWKVNIALGEVAIFESWKLWRCGCKGGNLEGARRAYHVQENTSSGRAQFDYKT